MMKWFWPGVTWTAALTSLALWFGAERVETDIAERTGHALSPYARTGFDVDGRDVVLKGMAPDPDLNSLPLRLCRKSMVLVISPISRRFSKKPVLMYLNLLKQ